MTVTYIGRWRWATLRCVLTGGHVGETWYSPTNPDAGQCLRCGRRLS